ncbi:hypothetical protein LCGC14_1881180 [marine sediment metagenome]|uniref:Uncharacterized protein n=1 Tax=marine sediment metagenome TaxID=412755 RepID=A0A0F9G2A0_9ZZZZ
MKLEVEYKMKKKARKKLVKVINEYYGNLFDTSKLNDQELIELMLCLYY